MSGSKCLSILRVPFDLGAGLRGTSLGPDAILGTGLEDRLRSLGYHITYNKTVNPKTSSPAAKITPAYPLRLNQYNEVFHINRALARKVSEQTGQGRFPLVLGGDHSLAIGTIAGLTNHKRSLGVIWFDAHSDMNTAETTPTGNIHGMSLAVSLGLGDERLTHLEGRSPKLLPQQVVIIGARDLDSGEKALIRKQGICCFTMHDIDRLGMARVMEETMRIVSSGTDGVHISFDIDSLDPLEAPGTGTPVKGGLSYREAHLALELLHESGIVTSAEFVEVNPALETDQRTARLAADLICSLLGETIL